MSEADPKAEAKAGGKPDDETPEKLSLGEIIDLWASEPGRWKGELPFHVSRGGVYGPLVAAVTLTEQSTASSVLRELAAQVDDPGAYLTRLTRLGSPSIKGRFGPTVAVTVTGSVWELVRGAPAGAADNQRRASSSSPASSPAWPSPAPWPTPPASPAPPDQVVMSMARELLADQDARTERMLGTLLNALDKERERSAKALENLGAAAGSSSNTDAKTLLELGELRASVAHMRDAPPGGGLAAFAPFLERPLDRGLGILERVVDARLEAEKAKTSATKAKARVQEKQAAVLEAEADRRLLEEMQRAKAAGVPVENLAVVDDGDAGDAGAGDDEAAE